MADDVVLSVKFEFDTSDVDTGSKQVREAIGQIQNQLSGLGRQLSRTGGTGISRQTFQKTTQQIVETINQTLGGLPALEKKLAETRRQLTAKLAQDQAKFKAAVGQAEFLETKIVDEFTGIVTAFALLENKISGARKAINRERAQEIAEESTKTINLLNNQIKAAREAIRKNLTGVATFEDIRGAARGAARGARVRSAVAQAALEEQGLPADAAKAIAQRKEALKILLKLIDASKRLREAREREGAKRAQDAINKRTKDTKELQDDLTKSVERALRAEKKKIDAIQNIIAAEKKAADQAELLRRFRGNQALVERQLTFERLRSLDATEDEIRELTRLQSKRQAEEKALKEIKDAEERLRSAIEKTNKRLMDRQRRLSDTRKSIGQQVAALVMERKALQAGLATKKSVEKIEEEIAVAKLRQRGATEAQIRTFKKENEAVKRLKGDLDKLRDAEKKATRETMRLGNEIKKTTARNNAFGLSLRNVVKGFILFRVFRGISRFTRELIEFISVQERARLAVAEVISVSNRFANIATGELVPATLQVSLGFLKADEAIKQLTEDAINIGLPLDELIKTFQTVAGVAENAGVQFEDSLEIFRAITVLAQRLSLPFSQVARSIDNIFTGLKVSQTQLGVILGLSQKQVQQWKRQGDLAEELKKKIEIITETLPRNLETFEGISQSLSALVRTLGKELTVGGFEILKDTLLDIRESLNRLRQDEEAVRRLREQFEEIVQSVRNLGEALLGILPILDRIGFAIAGVGLGSFLGPKGAVAGGVLGFLAGPAVSSAAFGATPGGTSIVANLLDAFGVLDQRLDTLNQTIRADIASRRELPEGARATPGEGAARLGRTFFIDQAGLKEALEQEGFEVGEAASPIFAAALGGGIASGFAATRSLEAAINETLQREFQPEEIRRLFTGFTNKGVEGFKAVLMELLDNREIATATENFIEISRTRVDNFRKKVDDALARQIAQLRKDDPGASEANIQKAAEQAVAGQKFKVRIGREVVTGTPTQIAAALFKSILDTEDIPRGIVQEFEKSLGVIGTTFTEILRFLGRLDETIDESETRSLKLAADISKQLASNFNTILQLGGEGAISAFENFAQQTRANLNDQLKQKVIPILDELATLLRPDSIDFQRGAIKDEAGLRVALGGTSRDIAGVLQEGLERERGAEAVKVLLAELDAVRDLNAAQVFSKMLALERLEIETKILKPLEMQRKIRQQATGRAREELRISADRVKAENDLADVRGTSDREKMANLLRLLKIQRESARQELEVANVNLKEQNGLVSFLSRKKQAASLALQEAKSATERQAATIAFLAAEAELTKAMMTQFDFQTRANSLAMEFETILIRQQTQIERLAGGFINVGDAIENAIAKIATGGDALKTLEDLGKQIGQKFVTEFIKSKLDLDAKIKVNFLKDIPNVLKEGGKKGGKDFGKQVESGVDAIQKGQGIFAKIKGFFGGGKTGATTGGFNQLRGGTGPTQIPSGMTAIAQGQGEGGAGFFSKIGAGIKGLGAKANAASGQKGLGTAGMGLAIGASFLSGSFGAVSQAADNPLAFTRGGRRSFSSQNLREDAAVRGLEATGFGGLPGVTSIAKRAPILGGAAAGAASGALIGAKFGGGFGAVVGAVIGGIVGAVSIAIIKRPSTESLVRKATKMVFKEIGIRDLRGFGAGGTAIRFTSDIRGEAREIFGDKTGKVAKGLEAIGEVGGLLGEAAQAGFLFAADQAAGLGTTRGVARSTTAALLNATAGLGLALEDARNIIGEFTRKTTKSLEEGFFQVIGRFQRGKLEREELQFAIGGLVNAFNDLPRAIDTAQLSLSAFVEDGRFSIEALKRSIEDAKTVIEQGLPGAIGAAIESGDPFTAVGQLAETMADTFVNRLTERLLASEAIGKSLTAAVQKATLAAEALAEGDQEEFAMQIQEAQKLFFAGRDRVLQTVAAILGPANAARAGFGAIPGGGIVNQTGVGFITGFQTPTKITVPGRNGRPQLAIVHGGEIIRSPDQEDRVVELLEELVEVMADPTPAMRQPINVQAPTVQLTVDGKVLAETARENDDRVGVILPNPNVGVSP